MARFYKVENEGKIYHVRFREERIFNSIDIYTFDANRRFFKRRHKISYLEIGVMMLMEADYGSNGKIYDSSSPSFLYELAQYAVDMAVRSERSQMVAQEERNNQVEYLNRYAVS